MEKLERIVNYLEKERLGIVGIFAALFTIIWARLLIERYLLGVPFQYFVLWTTAFFFMVFLFGVWVMSSLTKVRPLKVANLIILGFPLLILPPIIDHFIFGKATRYMFMSVEPFLENPIHALLAAKGAAPGQILQVAIMLSISALYIFIKTRSIPKAVAGGFSIYFFVFVMSNQSPFYFLLKLFEIIVNLGLWTYPLLIAIWSAAAYLFYKKKNYVLAVSLVIISFLIFFSAPSLHGFLDLYFKRVAKAAALPLGFSYLLISTLLLGLIFKLENKKIIGAISRRVTAPPTLFFVSLVLFGILVAGIGYDFVVRAAIMVSCAVLSIFFTWVSTVALNDIHDLKIDKISRPSRGLVSGEISSGHYKALAFSAALLALGYAYFIETTIVLLILAALLLAVAYSTPPLRLREKIYGTTIIGAGAAIAFLTGYFSQGAPLNPTAIVISLVAFLAFTFGSMAKGLQDLSADKKTGVKNLFTLLGKDKGKQFIEISLVAIFILPILILNQIQDLLIFAALGITSAYLFHKKENVNLIFASYFILLFYVLLRIKAIA